MWKLRLFKSRQKDDWYGETDDPPHSGSSAVQTTSTRPNEKKRVVFLSWICDPNHRPYRYAIAILIALVQGMLSYIVDMPGGIQATLIRVLRMDNSQYNMIFSAYTWADIVMSVVGTIIVNQFLGARIGFIVFLIIVLLGQLLYAIGGFVNSFLFSLLGRIIIGVGMGTSVSVLISFNILWFEGKEINFVLSLTRCMCRTMATLSLFTPQLTYNALKPVIPSSLNRLGTSHMVGVLCSVIAVICALCVVLLDIHGARVIGRKPSKKKKVNILHVLHFPASFWIVSLVSAIYFAVLISFTANAPLFFVSKYDLSLTLAYLANSLSYGSIVVISPFVALAIDFVGYNLVWGSIGIWMVIIAILLFITVQSAQFIPFLSSTIISLSYSFFIGAWLVLPGFIVKSDQVITAYGVCMSMYALVVSVVVVIAGVIIDHYGYLLLLIFYIVLLYLNSMLVFALSILI